MTSDESMKGGDADKQGDRPWWRRDITVFGKKLREQRLWKVEKISFNLVFLVLQLPENYF
jgi:hypothetical protein